MMNYSNQLLLGYEYEPWYFYGTKEPILTDFSISTNKHIIIAGLSGGGKTYATKQLLARMFLLGQEQGIKILFADFKGDDSYIQLRNCTNYFSYEQTLDALNILYDTLHKRQNGEDNSRSPHYLIWEEYLSNVLSLKTKDKKLAEKVMQQVAEILSIGRSLNVNLCITTQTAYASVFPEGSRNNFGIIMICGAPLRSIYELLLPKEYIEKATQKTFKKGEGVILLQGSDLHFMKVPWIQNESKLNEICIQALS